MPPETRATKNPALAGFFADHRLVEPGSAMSGSLERLDARTETALVARGLVAMDQATGAETVEDRLRDVEGFLCAGGVVGLEGLEHFLDGGAQHRTLAVVAQVAHDSLLGALLGGLDIGHNEFLDGPGLPGLSVGRENEREIMGNSEACVNNPLPAKWP